MGDAWDEAVDRVNEDAAKDKPLPKPRPIRGGQSGRGRSDIGPDDVLRMVRSFTGTQDDPLSTTLRSLANRFGIPEPAATSTTSTEEVRVAEQARAALLARLAELAKTADTEQLAQLAETWALLSGPRITE
jgi:hypothetical protein